jgi:hypothetical protein
MTEPTPDANWPSVWTLSAARMSSFSAYREAAGVTGRPFCPRRIVPILSIPEAGDW